METNLNSVFEGAASLQRIWVETVSRLGQAAFTVQPGSTPPDSIRQVRSGMFQALSDSWDSFLRSPQFQEGMRQWMDQSIRWRKASNDWMIRIRKELQAPSREDIDSVMLTVRHMEQRLLNRLDDLSVRLEQVATAQTESRVSQASGKPARAAKSKKAGAARGRQASARQASSQ